MIPVVFVWSTRPWQNNVIGRTIVHVQRGFTACTTLDQSVLIGFRFEIVIVLHRNVFLSLDFRNRGSIDLCHCSSISRHCVFSCRIWKLDLGKSSGDIKSRERAQFGVSPRMFFVTAEKYTIKSRTVTNTQWFVGPGSASEASSENTRIPKSIWSILGIWIWRRKRILRSETRQNQWILNGKWAQKWLEIVKNHAKTFKIFACGARSPNSLGFPLRRQDFCDLVLTSPGTRKTPPPHPTP